MTPQLTSQPDNALGLLSGDSCVTPHLTEDQFGELLAASAGSATSSLALAHTHLLVCEQCTSEFARLRDSLSLFRHASTAYADNQLRRLPQISIPARHMLPFVLEPPYFVAAAALLLAAILPMQTWHRHLAQQVPASAASVQDRPAESESDDALLEDVSRDLSASVPAPMQALADPTGADFQTSIQNPDQRNVQP
jgi:hypothetical protein